jgi:hypothetical protein
LASNNETCADVGGLSRPGPRGPRLRRRDAAGPVNDAETKGEYRSGHGDSITEVRGTWSTGFRAQVRWIAGRWVTGRRVTGRWIAGGRASGRRVTSRLAPGVESTGSRCKGPSQFWVGGEISRAEQWA